MRSSTWCLLTASAILCLAVSLAPYDHLQPVYEITKWSCYPEVYNHVSMIASSGHQILQRLVRVAELLAIILLAGVTTFAYRTRFWSWVPKPDKVGPVSQESTVQSLISSSGDLHISKSSSRSKRTTYTNSDVMAQSLLQRGLELKPLRLAQRGSPKPVPTDLRTDFAMLRAQLTSRMAERSICKSEQSGTAGTHSIACMPAGSPLFNHLSQMKCTRFKELATSLLSRSQRDQKRQPSEDVHNSLLAPQSAYARLKAEMHRTKLELTPFQAQSATFGQQARAAIDESANLSEQVKAAQEAASQMHLHDLEVQRNLERNLAVLSRQVASQLSTIEMSNQKTAVLKQLVSTLRSRNQIRRQGSYVAQRKLVTFKITCARLTKDLRQVQQQLTRCQAQSSFLQARAEAASDRSVKVGKQLQVAKQSALQARLQNEEVQRKLESALADMATLKASTISCQYEQLCAANAALLCDLTKERQRAQALQEERTCLNTEMGSSRAQVAALQVQLEHTKQEAEAELQKHMAISAAEIDDLHSQLHERLRRHVSDMKGLHAQLQPKLDEQSRHYEQRLAKLHTSHSAYATQLQEAQAQVQKLTEAVRAEQQTTASVRQLLQSAEQQGFDASSLLPAHLWPKRKPSAEQKQMQALQRQLADQQDDCTRLQRLQTHAVTSFSEAGKAAMGKHDYNSAAHMYSDAVKCHGSSCQNDSCSDKTLHSQLLVDRGGVYYQQDRFMHALADCNRALQLIPNCSKALTLRFNGAEKYNDTARVLQDLEMLKPQGTQVSEERLALLRRRNSTSSINHHVVLGVSCRASIAEIKAAHRKLIVQLHTDKQAGVQTPDSAATMVNAAKQHLVK